MKITLSFFKISGNYYMDEDFEIPDKIKDWCIVKELKKKKRLRTLILGSCSNSAVGFYKSGFPFLITPYNF